jgi:hypothetical protein
LASSSSRWQVSPPLHLLELGGGEAAFEHLERVNPHLRIVLAGPGVEVGHR